MTLRDLDIDVDVRVKSAGIKKVNEDINRLVEDIQRIDDDIMMNVSLNDSGADEELRELNRLTDELDRKKPNIKVDMDTAQIEAEIARLTREIEELDRNDVFIDVDLKNANKQIVALRAHLLSIERTNIDIDVDTTAAHAQLAALKLHTQTLKGAPDVDLGQPFLTTGLGSIVKIFGIVSMLIIALPVVASLLQALVGLIGVLGVAIGVVTGGLFAFAMALGVAAMGIGGFALVGITSIAALYEEDAKLTKSQKALKKETDGLIKSFDVMKKKLEPLTFRAITSGVAFLKDLMGDLTTPINNATNAIGKMFKSLDKAIDGPRMQNFFDYLDRAVGPLTTNLGNGIGYFAQGILNWMVALEPLTNWVAQGFENMMGRFDDWTASLQNSERMTAFIDYVKQNLPVIGDIFADGRDGIVNWFAAFDNTAADGLGWMADKMKEFSTWSSQLDQDESFQQFLETIKTDGPVVAEIIGNMSSNLVNMINALSDSGILEKIEKLTSAMDPEAIANNISFKSIFKPNWLSSLEAFGFDFGDFAGRNLPENQVTFDVNADTSKATAEINKVKEQVYNPLQFPVEPILSPLQKPTLPPLDAEIKATKIQMDVAAPKVPVTAEVKKVETLGPMKLNTENAVKKATVEFNWPPLPRFTWPTLPVWVWPSLPVFRWPAYPKFSWPPMPKVTVNVSGAGGRLPGFSTGLGRVKDDMAAIVHKEEAILPASQAQTLRDMGVLEGEGRYPTLNTSPLASTSTSNSTTNNQSAVVQNTFHIVVQGGNTNEETGAALVDVLEDFFASMHDIVPLTREV